MEHRSPEDKVLVLVVDDEPTVRFLARAVIERAGYRAEEAQNGDEALRIVPSLRPDLILLDVNMPGIDGFAVCRELRRSGHTNPVILMTGDIRDDVARRGREAGAEDVLRKPFALADLRNLLRDVLGEGRTIP